jgi:hypothetical protein
MKTLLRILAMVGLTVVMFSLTECNPNNDRVADNEDIEVTIERERAEISEDLKELRKDLDREIEQINQKLKNATESERERLEDANNRLSDDKARVNETLEALEETGSESWKEVKTAAQTTSRDVRAAFRELSHEVNDLFDGKERD